MKGRLVRKKDFLPAFAFSRKKEVRMYYHEINLRTTGTAMMKAYILDEEITHRRHIKRPLMVICPGGGYLTLAHRESEPVVARFLGAGYNVVLVDYSVYFKQRPNPGEPGVVNQGFRIADAVQDLVQALNIIQENSDAWFIETSRIYLLGFSAGAHLVGTVAENYRDPEWQKRFRVQFTQLTLQGLILAYPMLTATEVNVKERDAFRDLMAREDILQLDLTQNVSAHMPRTFIWQGNEDQTVNPLTTTQFILKLQQAGVPCEYHLYEKGGHGVALADRTSATTPDYIVPNLAQWVTAVQVWLAQDDGELTLYPDLRE